MGNDGNIRYGNFDVSLFLEDVRIRNYTQRSCAISTPLRGLLYLTSTSKENKRKRKEGKTEKVKLKEKNCHSDIVRIVKFRRRLHHPAHHRDPTDFRTRV